MKKVIMIFSTNENMGAINYLHNQLENVFESEIEIEDVFLDALNRNEKLEADAYLIVSEDILELLKNNISDCGKRLGGILPADHVQPLRAGFRQP